MLLYKYYPCNQNTFKSLAAQGLWCHRAAAMNDPFECMSGLDVPYSASDLAAFRDYVRHNPELARNPRIAAMIGAQDDALNDLLNRVLGDLRKKLIDEMAFCALSEKPDNVLMWSHYADSHRGCVIGIEFPDRHSHLQKVLYDEAPRKPDVKKVADFINGKDDEEFVSELLSNISVKGQMWGYEDEWRIWRREPTYFYYKWEWIKEVYFGVNCPPEIKSLVVKLLDGLDDGFMFYELEMRYDPLRLEW